jgi:hypothetical protein
MTSSDHLENLAMLKTYLWKKKPLQQPRQKMKY